MNPTSVKALIRPEIQAMSAYAVQPAEGMVKLDAMENPFPWPGELQDAWLNALRGMELNRYPDPQAAELKDLLRQVFKIPEAAQVTLGNGSDELIQMLAMAVATPDRVLLAPEPSFVMYRLVAGTVGMRFVGVPLTTEFELERGAILDAIAQTRPALIFIAYPNNPTGNLFERETICAIIDTAPGLVVIDEAYSAFSNDSFLPDVMAYQNLIVMRTVSKIGLAGLRLGFIAAAKGWIEQLEKIRLPYNISSLTQFSAAFALRHYEQLGRQAESLVAERHAFGVQLSALNGLQPYESQANFILLKVPEGRASPLHSALRDGGVLVKNLDSASPALRDCLRITVGAPSENALVINLLKRALAG